MLITKYNRFYFILLSFIVIILDQLTKHLIEENYNLIINKDLIIFRLDYVKNFGAAFDLFSGSRIFLSIVSLIITLILLYIIIYKNNVSNIDLLSYSFVLGGTLGNGYDRITKGFVIDFINLNFISFPVFNLADISINIGIVLLIYSLIKYKK